eukprot:TRINITY_DN16694_c0_g1_i1.p1 TRINITY_DN16694_c0_g1~~TRINITY_DN16694_c0_g1_i1.p1  ORF type:complete len:494 (-),score=72.00 TRINITY_DN16694_c0_g1_i1:45-1526(-)
MVALNGVQVKLDDLFGYTKLSELLATLIGCMSNHEETIAQLRKDSGSIAARFGESGVVSKQLQDQTALIAKLRRDCDSLVEQVGNQSATVEKARTDSSASLAEVKDLRVTMKQLRAESEKVNETIRRRQSLLEDATADRGTSMDRRLALIDERFEDIRKQFSGGQEAQDRIERLPSAQNRSVRPTQAENDNGAGTQNIDGAKYDGSGAVDECQGADLTAKVAALEEAFQGPGGLPDQVEALNTFCRDVDARMRAHGDSLTGLSESVGVLSSSLDAARAELKASVHKSGGWPQRASDDVASPNLIVDQLARDIGVMKADIDNNIRSDIKDVSVRENTNANRLARELLELRRLLNEFLEQGSSATARCLSCFTQRAQVENPSAVGKDGKLYGHMERPRSATAKMSGRRGSGLLSEAAPVSRPASAVQGAASAAARRQIAPNIEKGMLSLAGQRHGSVGSRSTDTLPRHQSIPTSPSLSPNAPWSDATNWEGGLGT